MLPKKKVYQIERKKKKEDVILTTDSIFYCRIIASTDVNVTLLTSVDPRLATVRRVTTRGVYLYL